MRGRINLHALLGPPISVERNEETTPLPLPTSRTILGFMEFQSSSSRVSRRRNVSSEGSYTS
jgi:hypothetical protein